jgi:hypothetical protein
LGHYSIVTGVQTCALPISFDLPGVPIRMMLRKGKNPYAEKAG